MAWRAGWPRRRRPSERAGRAATQRMWILRLLGVLVLVAVIGGFVSYLLTGNEKYLRFAGRLFRYALIVAFLLFALLILERVAVIPV